LNHQKKRGGPYRLNCKFYNKDGSTSFEIVGNEWFGYDNNWDIEHNGNRIIIRKSKGEIALIIGCYPPFSIAIEQMDMVIQNVKLWCNKEIFIMTGYSKLENRTGSKFEFTDYFIKTKDGLNANENGSITATLEKWFPNFIKIKMLPKYIRKRQNKLKRKGKTKRNPL